jgi:hypothetical protein
MVRSLILLLLLFTSFSACSQDSSSTKYALGFDSISIATKCYLRCDSNVVFIQLHEDEKTGVEAAEEYLLENGGFLAQVKHSGTRRLDFEVKNLVYNVDPNRIFSTTGIKANLTKLRMYKPEVARAVNRFAKDILKNYVDGKKLIVALHNNTEEKFSILSYKKGMAEALNASKVFINEAMDPDDFILTTDTSIYRRIKEKNINVVLQSANAKDDGSLSVYAQRKNIPYINIEAQHDHFYEQREMLYAIKDIITSYSEIVDLNYIGYKK